MIRNSSHPLARPALMKSAGGVVGDVGAGALPGTAWAEAAGEAAAGLTAGLGASAGLVGLVAGLAAFDQKSTCGLR